MGTLLISAGVSDAPSDSEQLSLSISATATTVLPAYSNAGTATTSFAALDYGGRASPSFVTFRNTGETNNLILSFDGTNNHIILLPGQLAIFPHTGSNIEVKSNASTTTYSYTVHD